MNRIHACLVGLLLCAASLPCAAQAPVAAKISSSELALQQQRESQAATRQLKRRIRAIVASADRRTIKTDYGLILDEGIVSRGLERGGKKPLVIAIHGYNSYPEHVQSILREPREAGMDCGVFSYPNDHEAAHSAKLLSQELKQLQQTDPQREVYLVAFSLGSVVAREAIENPQLDPGNVRRLVMISPPNQGSSLANFAYAMDLWEFIGSERRRELGLFFAAVEDGLAEASVDLRPGSLFLKTLNSRQRNDQVQYSIFLGDQGSALRCRRAKIVLSGCSSLANDWIGSCVIWMKSFMAEETASLV